MLLLLLQQVPLSTANSQQREVANVAAECRNVVGGNIMNYCLHSADAVGRIE